MKWLSAIGALVGLLMLSITGIRALNGANEPNEGWVSSSRWSTSYIDQTNNTYKNEHYIRLNISSLRGETQAQLDVIVEPETSFMQYDDFDKITVVQYENLPRQIRFLSLNHQGEILEELDVVPIRHIIGDGISPLPYDFHVFDNYMLFFAEGYIYIYDRRLSKITISLDTAPNETQRSASPNVHIQVQNDWLIYHDRDPNPTTSDNIIYPSIRFYKIIQEPTIHLEFICQTSIPNTNNYYHFIAVANDTPFLAKDSKSGFNRKSGSLLSLDKQTCSLIPQSLLLQNSEPISIIANSETALYYTQDTVIYRYVYENHQLEPIFDFSNFTPSNRGFSFFPEASATDFRYILFFDANNPKYVSVDIQTKRFLYHRLDHMGYFSYSSYAFGRRTEWQDWRGLIWQDGIYIVQMAGQQGLDSHSLWRLDVQHGEPPEMILTFGNYPYYPYPYFFHVPPPHVQSIPHSPYLRINNIMVDLEQESARFLPEETYFKPMERITWSPAPRPSVWSVLLGLALTLQYGVVSLVLTRRRIS